MTDPNMRSAIYAELIEAEYLRDRTERDAERRAFDESTRALVECSVVEMRGANAASRHRVLALRAKPPSGVLSLRASPDFRKGE